MAGVLTYAVIGVPTIRLRSGIGRRNRYMPENGEVLVVHTVREIDPDEVRNISLVVAFE